jgi:hypothetical protein
MPNLHTFQLYDAISKLRADRGVLRISPWFWSHGDGWSGVDHRLMRFALGRTDL